MLKYEQKSTLGDGVVRDVKKILSRGKTPYQEYLFFESYQNGVCIAIEGDIQSCEADEAIYHEALVQPAMLLHPEPKTVLIMGGGEGATAREVLKHDKTLQKAVMVDIDKEFVEVCQKVIPSWSQGVWDNEKLQVHYMDINEYFDKTDDRFDVVIGDLVDVDDWDSFLANLYSESFYERLKKLLNPGAIVATQAGALNTVKNTNHINVRKSLKEVFQNVYSYGIVVPSFYSLWGYVLASDVKIEVDAQTISERIASRGVALEMVDGEDIAKMFVLPKGVRESFAK